MYTEIRVSTVDLGKENSSAARAGLQTCNLSIMSPAL